MLNDCLADILQRFDDIRSRSRLSAEGEGANLFGSLKSAIESTEAVQSRPQLECDWSIGKGNWSAVPWVRLFDSRYSSRKKGLYCAYLFREDMTGVYLVVMQSVYRFSSRKGIQVLQNRAHDIAGGHLQGLPDGFGLGKNSEIDLRSTKQLPELYEAAVVIDKYYDRENMPDTSECHADLENVLSCYLELAKNTRS